MTAQPTGPGLNQVARARQQHLQRLAAVQAVQAEQARLQAERDAKRRAWGLVEDTPPAPTEPEVQPEPERPPRKRRAKRLPLALWHVLTDVDPETRTGTCNQCGPGAQAIPQTAASSNPWTCAEGRRASRRRARAAGRRDPSVEERRRRRKAQRAAHAVGYRAAGEHLVAWSAQQRAAGVLTGVQATKVRVIGEGLLKRAAMLERETWVGGYKRQDGL